MKGNASPTHQDCGSEDNKDERQRKKDYAAPEVNCVDSKAKVYCTTLELLQTKDNEYVLQTTI